MKGKVVPVGSRTLEPKSGMWRVKTDNGWEFEHLLKIRERFPLLPADYKVRFVDGDRSNTDPRNLVVDVPVPMEHLTGVPYPVTTPLAVAPMVTIQKPRKPAAPARKRPPRIEVPLGDRRGAVEALAEAAGLTVSQYVLSLVDQHLINNRLHPR